MAKGGSTSWAPALRALALIIPISAQPVCALAQPVGVPFAKNEQGGGENVTAQLSRETAGLLAVNAFVNGQGPFRFIVDTGANRSVVSRGLTQRLNLESAGQDYVHGVTGVRIADMVRVQSLSAGAVLLRDVDLPILEQDMLGGADGMLGVEAMAGKRLEIDNKTNQLTLQTSSGAKPSADWRRISVTFQFGQLAVVKGRIGNVPITVVIDTGAERSLANPALASALTTQAKRTTIPGTRITSAAKPLLIGESLTLPPVSLGDKVQMDGTTAFVGAFHVFDLWGLQDQPALLLGMDALGGTEAFAIDYARSELQIRLF